MAILDKPKAVASRFWKIVDQLCHQPDHLQRLAIIAAGTMMYPLVVGLVLIIWRGGWEVVHQSEQLSILGYLAFGSMALWGLVVVALLGIIRGFRATLPGGASVELDIDNVNNEDEDGTPGTLKPNKD